MKDVDVWVASRGRVTIPITLRLKFGIMSGSRSVIEVDEDGRHIILAPITRETIHRLRGKYKG